MYTEYFVEYELCRKHNFTLEINGSENYFLARTDFTLVQRAMLAVVVNQMFKRNAENWARGT